MANTIKYTRDSYVQSAAKGIRLDDVVRKDNAKYLEDKYKNDERHLIEIAMQEAGFDNYTNMYDLFNYSQSTSNDNVLYPAYIDTMLKVIRENNLQDIIYPLLLASDTTIPSDSYRGIYVDYGTDKNKKNLMWQGIAEGADFPTVSVTSGQKALQMYKSGIAVKQTYESMRRITVDIVQQHLDRLARHMGSQILDLVLKVLLEGDGNSNAIPNEMKFTTETAAILTTKDLIKSSVEFADVGGLSADTYVCTKGAFIDLAQIYVDSDKSNGMVPGAVFTFPQNILGGATIVYAKNLALDNSKERIIMLNRANGIGKLTEAGSIINEEDTKIENQTVTYTLSEVSAFQKLDPYSVGSLTYK